MIIVRCKICNSLDVNILPYSYAVFNKQFKCNNCKAALALYEVDLVQVSTSLTNTVNRRIIDEHISEPTRQQ